MDRVLQPGDDPKMAVPKHRPKSIMDGFSNRSKTVKKNNPPPKTPRDSRSVTGSSSGITLVDQFRYLQEEHKKMTLKYNTLKQDHHALEERHKRLNDEHKTLKKSYDELQENYKGLLDSQKSFNAGKLLVYLKLKRRTDKETLEKRNIIRNEACFNTYLEDVIKDPTLGIPKIVVECVTAVESSEKFMQASGLYRASGNHNVIQNLRYDINEDNYKKLRKQKSPHEICGLLKLFLRELKEPVIPLAQLNRIIPGSSDMSEQDNLVALKRPTRSKRFSVLVHSRTLKVLELVNSLDDLRKNTLRYLMKHFKKVVDVPENEMDSLSLGILMSSCIFNETLTDVCPQRFETMSAVPRECIITMIENYDEIFSEK